MQENTLLHRQIHPTFVINELVASQAFSTTKLVASSAFTPTANDRDQLSVYNGDKFSPKESHAHYTQLYQSFGVLSLTVAEVVDMEPLKALEDNIPFDGHCFIDFSEIGSKTQKAKKAGLLRDLAVARDWTYLPE